MTAINSPFRYAGGKFYARRLILEHLPEHNKYVEPFCGGASIFFAKKKVADTWLNDLDEKLINCLLHIRDNPEKLIDRLAGEEATKERHAYYKNKYNPMTPLDHATRWFYLNRTSYSGIMKMENCYFGYGDKFSMRPENWARHIRKCSEKLQGVNITTGDFEDVINNAENDSFLFIDPPYFNADQDKFYSCIFSLEEHLRLCRVLRKNSHRLKFLLTYDNSPEIRALYNWATEIYDKEWHYTLNRTDDQKNGSDIKGKRYKGKEIFVLNYTSLFQPTLI